MKIDCHVHYKKSARHSETHEEAMVLAAKAKGLDAIVFTEHHTVLPKDRLAELNEVHAPFRVFQGVELTAWELQDYLVYGVPWGEVPMPRFKRIKAQDVLALAVEHGAAVCLAHPLHKPERNVIDPLFFKRGGWIADAVEVASGYIVLVRPSSIALAVNFGIYNELTMLTGSDAHLPEHMTGLWYNVSRAPITTDAELVAAIKDPDAWESA